MKIKGHLTSKFEVHNEWIDTKADATSPSMAESQWLNLPLSLNQSEAKLMIESILLHTRNPEEESPRFSIFRHMM